VGILKIFRSRLDLQNVPDAETSAPRLLERLLTQMF
jgi:hypothetical protein